MKPVKHIDLPTLYNIWENTGAYNWDRVARVKLDPTSEWGDESIEMVGRMIHHQIMELHPESDLSEIWEPDWYSNSINDGHGRRPIRGWQFQGIGSSSVIYDAIGWPEISVHVTAYGNPEGDDDTFHDERLDITKFNIADITRVNHAEFFDKADTLRVLLNP